MGATIIVQIYALRFLVGRLLVLILVGASLTYIICMETHALSGMPSTGLEGRNGSTAWADSMDSQATALRVKLV